MNKAISFLKLMLVLASSLVAQGCVGIVVRGMEEQAYEPARVAEKPSTYAVGSSPSIGKGLRTEDPTATWLRDHWGQPSHVLPGRRWFRARRSHGHKRPVSLMWGA